MRFAPPMEFPRRPRRQRCPRSPRHLGSLAPVSLLLAALALLSACDPDGKKQCAWVLEPEPKLEGTTDPGYIPVCARNRTTMKEDCSLQATLDYAKEVYGRKFRFVDIRFTKAAQPRVVSNIKFCDGKD